MSDSEKIVATEEPPKEKIIPNKCTKVRCCFEDSKTYRIISFIVDHPSKLEEDHWQRFELNGETFIIDKLTWEILNGSQCELLTINEDKSPEPSIVAVKIYLK